jgi:hypothetical protein
VGRGVGASVGAGVSASVGAVSSGMTAADDVSSGMIAMKPRSALSMTSCEMAAAERRGCCCLYSAAMPATYDIPA